MVIHISLTRARMCGRNYTEKKIRKIVFHVKTKDKEKIEEQRFSRVGLISLSISTLNHSDHDRWKFHNIR